MIICVVGPTGVGKTKLSIALAKKYNAIIVNCDAMQVYKGMDIGTAKIKESEKENIPHYLFDFVDPTINYTVADYQKDARKILEENKNKNIIFVGGTGLYLKAVLYNYTFNEINDTNYDNYTNEELYNMSLKLDPSCNIHINNRKRLIAFLKRNGQTHESKQIYNATIIGLTTDRNNLYNIIDNRVDAMLEEGLEEEVYSFYKNKIYSKALTTAIGYKELYEYFDGNINKEEAISKIKQNSRRYAKRQYTFFNHQLNVNWLNVDYNNFNNTIKEAIKIIDRD